MGSLARVNAKRAHDLRMRRLDRAIYYLTKLQGKPAKTLWIAEAIAASEAYTRKLLKGCLKFKPAEQRGFWVLSK